MIKIFCINLKARSDRWSSMHQYFLDYKIDGRRFSAIEGPPNQGYIGCYLSHKRILEDSYDKGLDMVCVLEDDVRFYSPSSFLSDLQKYIQNLPSDWHILYLGGLVMRDAKLIKINDLIYRTEGFLCTYGIVYNARSYKNILDGLNLNESYKIKIPRIDNWYAQYYQKSHPCYVCSNFLLYEKGDRSDIELFYKNTRYIYSLRYFLYKKGFSRLLKIIGYIGDIFLLSNRYKFRDRNL